MNIFTVAVGVDEKIARSSSASPDIPRLLEPDAGVVCLGIIEPTVEYMKGDATVQEIKVGAAIDFNAATYCFVRIPKSLVDVEAGPFLGNVAGGEGKPLLFGGTVLTSRSIIIGEELDCEVTVSIMAELLVEIFTCHWGQIKCHPRDPDASSTTKIGSRAIVFHMIASQSLSPFVLTK